MSCNFKYFTTSLTLDHQASLISLLMMPYIGQKCKARAFAGLTQGAIYPGFKQGCCRQHSLGPSGDLWLGSSHGLWLGHSKIFRDSSMTSQIHDKWIQGFIILGLKDINAISVGGIFMYFCSGNHPLVRMFCKISKEHFDKSSSPRTQTRTCGSRTEVRLNSWPMLSKIK